MKLIEIRNNLVKLSYEADENPTLGRFIALTHETKSYIAQFVNLKYENDNGYAIAKLMFTFSSDGIVDVYDGSIPNLTSNIVPLASSELLELLPIETPLKIGSLAQENAMLNVDVSIFEHNLTVFSEHSYEKTTFISNCVRQLFLQKEKSVIVDIDNSFDTTQKLTFGKDFKLPLNATMIDFILDTELSEIDVKTKAVIQDIFYAIRQYVETLEEKFLPIDNFIDVIAYQYQETLMPELALLKNKFLRYKEANVFANSKSEITALHEYINDHNCTILDIKQTEDELQREILRYVHSVLENIESYVYFFVSLTDGNSDKQLIKKFINHNKIFTTILCGHSFKYTPELKEQAQNLLLFTPQVIQNNFASYNTFLNKLNYGEAIICGKLTQEIPFIVEISDLDLDLTKEDVFANRLVPEKQEKEPPITSENEENATFENEKEQQTPLEPLKNQAQDEELKEEDLDIFDDYAIEEPNAEEEIIEEEEIEEGEIEEREPEFIEEQESSFNEPKIIEPVENIMLEEPEEIISEEEPAAEILENDEDAYADTSELFEDSEENELSEEDLDFIEGNEGSDEGIEMTNIDEILDEDEDEGTPVVPVYTPEDTGSVDIEYSQGDVVNHPRYGRGVVEKIINYGNKTLCSISFDNVGRRLLDPSISEFEKIE